jgi:nucleoid-associated protein YgaU
VSTLAVTLALGALLLSGQGALEWPPLTAPAEWHTWFTEREPADAIVALVRLATLASCWYMLAATAAGVIARALSAGRLIRVTDALSLPTVRATVRWALGTGLAASTALAGSPAIAARPAAPAITMTRLPDPSGPVPVPPAVHPGSAAAPAAPSPVASAPPTWEVRPGQSLWTIARDTESLRRGRPASDREVSAYWRALIDVNRDRLADPRNPHRVFPAQVFRLPPPLLP